MPVDYAKLLRMGMPLAVPHQKPPNKLRSHLYPIFLSDAAALQVSMAGSGYILSVPMDFLSLGASIGGVGELRSIYQTLTIETDNMTIQASIAGNGELRSVYQATNISTDSTSIQASIAGSGELKRVLITYDNKHDDITIQATMTGTGTLQ